MYNTVNQNIIPTPVCTSLNYIMEYGIQAEDKRNYKYLLNIITLRRNIRLKVLNLVSMKYYILIVILLANLSSLIAQQTFEKIISKPEDQKINSIIEDTLGNYCMVGKIKNINTGLYAGYLVRIDSLGNLMNEKEFQDSDTTMC